MEFLGSFQVGGIVDMGKVGKVWLWRQIKVRLVYFCLS